MTSMAPQIHSSNADLRISNRRGYLFLSQMMLSVNGRFLTLEVHSWSHRYCIRYSELLGSLHWWLSFCVLEGVFSEEVIRSGIWDCHSGLDVMTTRYLVTLQLASPELTDRCKLPCPSWQYILGFGSHSSSFGLVDKLGN